MFKWQAYLLVGVTREQVCSGGKFTRNLITDFANAFGRSFHWATLEKLCPSMWFGFSNRPYIVGQIKKLCWLLDVSEEFLSHYSTVTPRLRARVWVWRLTTLQNALKGFTGMYFISTIHFSTICRKISRTLDDSEELMRPYFTGNQRL